VKRIGTTSTGASLVEIASTDAKNLVTCLQAIGAALSALDGLLTLAPEAGHPGGVLPPAAAPAPASSEEAGKKRAARVTQPTLAKRPGRVCATRTSSGESRKCLTCGESFQPKRKDQRCCSKQCNRNWWNANRKRTPTAPKPPAPPAVPTKPAANPDRLRLIREADARARLKVGGILAPDLTAGSDSGVRQATPEDIAAVRGS